MKTISLSLSIIQADNRVIRQCNALSKAGYDVIAFGLYGEEIRQSQYNFTIKTIGGPSTSTNLSFKKKLRKKLKNIETTCCQFLESNGAFYTLRLFKTTMKAAKGTFRTASAARYIGCFLGLPNAWRRVFWREGVFNAFLNAAEKEDFSDVKLIIANDWQMLPIAKYLGQKYGIKFAYDSHEHALSENHHLWLHRYLTRKYLFQLEASNLKGVSFVTSVSQGILDALKQQYNLECPCFVVRSTPYYHDLQPRPVNADKITLYFHGYLKENRLLDSILKSLVYLNGNYHLLYRGGHHSSADYERHLMAMAKELGVEHRFKIVPLAMHEEIIPLASEADIGLTLLPSESLHFNMALPNKFFEYVMSGLAIGVSNLKEMGDYIKKYDLGFVVDDLSPESIARQIAAISVDDINRYKQNALSAAKELNWECDQDRFIGNVQRFVEH